jgi:catechol 2,3-dioxygenase-like lactoylglutathione lyase family enzyme
MTLLDGIHHVSLNVDDAEAGRAFYEDVLGLSRLDRPDFGIPGFWLDAGDFQIHLIEIPDHQAPAGQHFAFRVEDLDRARSRLVEQGVEVSDPSPVGPGRQCFLHDPAGNLIELNQPDDVP